MQTHLGRRERDGGGGGGCRWCRASGSRNPGKQIGTLHSCPGALPQAACLCHLQGGVLSVLLPPILLNPSELVLLGKHLRRS